MTFQCFLYEDGVAEDAWSRAGSPEPSTDRSNDSSRHPYPEPFFCRSSPHVESQYAMSSEDVRGLSLGLDLDNCGAMRTQSPYGGLLDAIEGVRSMPDLLGGIESTQVSSLGLSPKDGAHGRQPGGGSSCRRDGDVGQLARADGFARRADGPLRFYVGKPGCTSKAEKVLDIYPHHAPFPPSLSDPFFPSLTLVGMYTLTLVGMYTLTLVEMYTLTLVEMDNSPNLFDRACTIGTRRRSTSAR
ncbi:uncharacterized protein SCHCODRAFT_02570882 [Schizophyllum commune H4-8]|nr:uncharacterized protein SCHCODRAFT_02570882 [Schizophyllum commune H4-8]KAI5897260.1 hypothetical protein SCHCODRAFT_02570882 [Schizophyllum commune H4-8]